MRLFIIPQIHQQQKIVDFKQVLWLLLVLFVGLSLFIWATFHIPVSAEWAGRRIVSSLL